MNVNKTLKEVIVRGFKFGTSMADLAQQLDVPLPKIEQTIRQRLIEQADAGRAPTNNDAGEPVELALINAEK